MFNPALIEAATNERLADLRNSRRRFPVAPATRPGPAQAEMQPPHRRRRMRGANPQQTIGWLLVSIGLRLVVPRTPARPAR
jgi:hypothetical protein